MHAVEYFPCVCVCMCEIIGDALMIMCPQITYSPVYLVIPKLMERKIHFVST